MLGAGGLLLALPLLCGAAAGLGAPRLLRFSGHVPEDSPAGTRVRGVRVPLRGPGEPPARWALRGDGAHHFSLQRRPGGERGALEARTARRLDRGARAEYRLLLRAAVRPRAALLRVRVLARDDRRPRLPPAARLEPSPRGSELARLRSSDGEESPEVPLAYRARPALSADSLPASRRLSLWVWARDRGRPRRLLPAVRGPGEERRRRRPRSLSPGPRRYAARLPPGARVGDTVFTLPRGRDAGGWFELAAPGAAPLGVDRASGRLYLRRELPAGGGAEALVKVHRGGGRGKGGRRGEAGWGCAGSSGLREGRSGGTLSLSTAAWKEAVARWAPASSPR